jgi:diguanylate cyclase (GGDEF)-like protein
VDERDLIDIESRVAQYPAQARSDIMRLTQALRKLGSSPTAAPAQALSHLYDSLTGLLNGGAYGVRFAMARARATRFRKIFAVMSVEVSFGAPAAGPTRDDRELAIKHVASRLEASVRATDSLARVGDESFAVILEDLTHSEHAERVKQIVLDALAEPLVIDGRPVAPEITVGIDFYPSPHQGSEGAPTYN